MRTKRMHRYVVEVYSPAGWGYLVGCRVYVECASAFHSVTHHLEYFGSVRFILREIHVVLGAEFVALTFVVDPIQSSTELLFFSFEPAGAIHRSFFQSILVVIPSVLSMLAVCGSRPWEVGKTFGCVG